MFIMKKLSVLLIAAVVAISASAGVTFKASHDVKSRGIMKAEKMAPSPKMLKDQPSRVITERPEGEFHS